MGALAGLSVPHILIILNVLGLPGLLFVFWWVDSRRMDAQQKKHSKEIQAILSQYKDDVQKVTDYYERNVELVQRYEKLSDDLSDIIHLNTQVQTRLVEKIESNMFCPIVRENGPRGGK